MLWKNRWMLTVSNQIIRVLPSFSFCYHSWPFPSKTDQSIKFSCGNSVPELPQKGKLFLTSQVIFSTLSSCPSDLIALSFFIWCAQQPNYFHDVAAFDCMVSVVRRLTEQSKTVKGIVSELESIGCVTKAKTFLLLLRIYWRGGMHLMVVETYEQMGSHGFAPNTFASNVLMDILFKIGRTDLALKVLKESQASNFLTFNIALFHLSKLNYVDHIKQVFRDLLRMGFYPNARTFEMLLNCFCKMNRLQVADQVLGLMIASGFCTSSKVWTILINGFCKQHRLDDACNLLERMIETGCSPNVVTYTTLIKAFMESKRITDAYNLLEKMIETGCSPNVVTYTTLIKAFMESKRITDACNLLGIMECSGQIPDLILYNVLIDCLSKVGRYQDALGVFISLSRQNIAPDSYTFCSLLSTVCLSRRFNLLPNLFSGHNIDADLVFCNALLNFFCKAGRPSLAVEFYNHMIDNGLTPDKYTLSGLLSGLIKIGNYHTAIRVLRNAIIQKYPLDIVSYTVGICGLLKSGRTQEACTFYDTMKGNGITPDVHTCNMMLSAICKGKDPEMVNWMLQEMIDLRAELSNRNFSNLCKYLRGSYTYLSTFKLLAEMRVLGLISAEALHDSCFYEHAKGAQAKYEHYTEALPEFNIVLDSSSSEDLWDVHASVC